MSEYNISKLKSITKVLCEMGVSSATLYVRDLDNFKSTTGFNGILYTNRELSEPEDPLCSIVYCDGVQLKIKQRINTHEQP